MAIADVFAAVQAALAPTSVPVWIPGDLPTQSGAYPNFKLRIESETKQSQGRGSIGFTTVVTIRLQGEVSEPVPIDDDVMMSTVVAQLTNLKTQAERAIINSYPLFTIVQQLVSVATQFAYTAQATRLAGIQCDYTFEIYEDDSDFPPPAPVVIQGFDVHLPPDPALTANPAAPVDGPGFSTTSDQE